LLALAVHLLVVQVEIQVLQVALLEMEQQK
jgi:hypothetical protein